MCPSPLHESRPAWAAFLRHFIRDPAPGKERVLGRDDSQQPPPAVRTQTMHASPSIPVRLSLSITFCRTRRIAPKPVAVPPGVGSVRTFAHAPRRAAPPLPPTRGAVPRPGQAHAQAAHSALGRQPTQPCSRVTARVHYASRRLPAWENAKVLEVLAALPHWRFDPCPSIRCGGLGPAHTSVRPRRAVPACAGACAAAPSARVEGFPAPY